MNRIIFVFVLLIAATTAAIAQNTGTIIGTVKLAGEDTVLHQASVQIVELNRTAITGQDGTYRFTAVPPGSYTLVAHQEGFADVRQKVTVETSAVTADFQLKISGLRENVTVTATGTEQSTFEAIESVSTLNSSQIATRAAVGLGEVLENESGMAKRTGGAGSSRPVMRISGVTPPSLADIA